MSEPVGHQPLTYTARVAAIRAILAEHMPTAGLVQNNRTANPIQPSDCLSASWGADAAGEATLTLAIYPVDDFAAEVEELRYGADRTAGSYEVQRAEPDGFALAHVHPAAVWVVVGHCEVYLSRPGTAPETLTEAAVEVARSVGYAPYTDDYEPPALPPDWSPPGYR